MLGEIQTSLRKFGHDARVFQLEDDDWSENAAAPKAASMILEKRGEGGRHHKPRVKDSHPALPSNLITVSDLFSRKV